MLKKEIAYENVDGDQVVRTEYFNISSAELIQLDADTDGGFSKQLQDIQKTDQMSVVYPLIINVISMGYGVRSDDGDFDKDPIHWAKFRKSLAYDALMEDLLVNDPANNGNNLADFFKAMLPETVRGRVEEAIANGFRPGADTSRPTPPDAREPQTQIGEDPAGLAASNLETAEKLLPVVFPVVDEASGAVVTATSRFPEQQQ
jgi:hypothetical protein